MTVLAVAHDPYWHGWTDDAGHRPDSAMVVTWLAPNRAALDELSRARMVLRPPLPDDRAHDRALHRPAHPRPGNGRSGVKEHASPHVRDRRLGLPNAFEDRLRREIGGISFAVGGLDNLVVDEPGERATDRGVPTRRRRPFDLTGLAASRDNCVGKGREPDVEDPQLFSAGYRTNVCAIGATQKWPPPSFVGKAALATRLIPPRTKG